MSEKRRRKREQTDEEEEGVVQPDERPIGPLYDLKSNMMTDPEDPDRDEAKRVGQDCRHDVLECRELLVCGARDVRDGQAESKDCHHGSKDSVREGLDPCLPESGNGACTRAHGPTPPRRGEVISSAMERIRSERGGRASGTFDRNGAPDQRGPPRRPPG